MRSSHQLRIPRLGALLGVIALAGAARGEGVYEYSESLKGTASHCNTTSCRNDVGIGIKAAVYNSTGSSRRWIIEEIDEQYYGGGCFGLSPGNEWTASESSGTAAGIPGAIVISQSDISAASKVNKGSNSTTLSIYDSPFYSFTSHPDPLEFNFVLRKTLLFKVEEPYDSGTYIPVDSSTVIFRGDLFLDLLPGADPADDTGLFTTHDIVVSFYIGGKHGPRIGDEKYPVIIVEPKVEPEDRNPLLCRQNPSSTATGLGSVQASFGLGPFEDHSPGATLALDLGEPTALLYDPQSLEYPSEEGFDRIQDGTTREIIQFIAPSVVVDVADDSGTAHKYVLTFYARDLTWPLLGSGAVDVPAGATALATVTVENPDTSFTTANEVRITRVEGADTQTWNYTYTVATSEWRLTGSETPWIECLVETDLADTDSDGFDEILERRTLENALGDPVSIVETTWEIYPFGTRPVKRVTDPGGRDLTETWSYFDNPSEPSHRYGRLDTRVTASGYWERYDYATTDPGSSNGATYVSRIVRQHLDAPVGSPESASNVEEIVFETPGRIRRSALLLGQEIARSFIIDLPGGYDEVVCRTPGADHLAADNLVTKWRYHTTGPFEDDLASAQRPDGTLDFYTYSLNPATGDKTTTLESGEPDPALDDIIDGTETVTITNVHGHVVATTVTDILSGLLIEQRLVTQVDASGRPTATTHLDGTSESVVHGCCGVDSRTDRRGITTSYTETGATRTETRLGITTTTTEQAYDNGTNEGRRSTLTRTGTDASSITLSLTETDLAGGLVRTRDARGEDTFYSEVIDPGTGHTLRTTTYPDGGTRIETLYPDGNLFTISGTAARPRKYEYGVDPAEGAFTKEILLDGGGGENEWTLSYTDLAGRVVKVVRPLPGGATATSQSFYNGLGQLERTVDADGVTTLFAYDARGRRNIVALDLDADDLIDFDGTDRITRTDATVTTRGATTVERTTTSAWITANDDLSETVLGITDRGVDGRDTWTDTGGLLTQTQLAYAGGGAWTETTTYPDSSRRIRQFTGGRLASDTLEDVAAISLLSTSYAYDPHGRLATLTDSRNATTTYTYHDDDQVDAVTTPVPNATDPAQVTSFAYDAMGRRDLVTLPDDTPGDPRQVDYDYFLTGDLQKVSGTRAYTVDYTYNAQGRLETLATAGGTTAWAYHPESGLLEKKTALDGGDTGYAYTAAGRLATRDTPRGIATTYLYNAAGQLGSISYSDATPGAIYTYDRLGRLATVDRAGMHRDFTYNIYGQLFDETVTGGALDGTSIAPGYDNLLRRTTLTATLGLNNVVQHFTWGAASRLASAAQNNHAAAYAYEPGAALVSHLAFSRDSAPVGSVTRQHDFLGRLTSTASASTGPAPLAESYAYTYNAANQRTRVDLPAGAHWAYDYDATGHLEEGKKYRNPGEPFAGQQFEYAYDAIGNRAVSKSGGDAGGAGLLTTGYTLQTADATRYDDLSPPGAVTVTGTADPAAAVTVNGEPAARQGAYFSSEIPVDNSTGAVHLPLTIEAALGSDTDTVTRSELVPPATMSCQYDLDGNITTDGLRSFTWDGENRLSRVETVAAALPPGAPEYRVDYEYDYLGRRIRRRLFRKFPPATAWILSSDRKFLYDGWNLIAEFENADELVRSYLWGLDLDGQAGGAPLGQGAGGVGGLLAITRYEGPHAGTAFATYDGNGNLTALIDASTSDRAAHYEYDPFGNPLAATGPLAHENPFRFSTKYHDPLPNLLYYGFRHYDPQLGRWLNRDPIGENGGVNLYSFLNNRPIGQIDLLGLNLYAIDGTGNHLLANSNVPNFMERYNDGVRHYYGGPGNPIDGVPFFGKPWGAGSAGIVDAVVEEICNDFVLDQTIHIDLVGFSRGAAIANEVAHTLVEKGCVCGTKRRGRQLIPIRTKPQIRFLGLFDTVHSLPFAAAPFWHQDSIAPNVENSAHAISLDETRTLFRRSLVRPSSPVTRHAERYFTGRHSDVGGSPSMNQNLARISLRWMVTRARAADIEMDTQNLVTDRQIQWALSYGLLRPGPQNRDPTALIND